MTYSVTAIYPAMELHAAGCADIKRTLAKHWSRNGSQADHTEDFSGETMLEVLEKIDVEWADMFGEEAYTQSSRDNGCWQVVTADQAPCFSAMLVGLKSDPETGRWSERTKETNVNEKTMLKCPGCKFEYARQSALDKHVTTIHPELAEAAGLKHEQNYDAQFNADDRYADEEAEIERAETLKPEPVKIVDVQKTSKVTRTFAPDESKWLSEPRPCANGCGYNVVQRKATYGSGSREKTYDVLVHTGIPIEIAEDVINHCVAK